MPASYDGTNRDKVRARFILDEDMNPAGGETWGEGFAIHWPVAGESHYGKAYLTEVIKGLEGRLEFYQTTKFQCWQNKAALVFLQAARELLENRADQRKERGVYNTHNV